MTEVSQATLEFLDNLNLPKWPQMLVWGEPVTVEQAKDIIFRTDPFLTSLSDMYGGNNHRWNEWARRVLGFDAFTESRDYAFLNRLTELFHETLGVVSTEYVHNNWASCSYVHGPHGWCHPNGTISFGDNIGKWPGALEVFKDWQAIAQAFPYLALKATLMSEEHDVEEAVSVPLVTFEVRNGEVSVCASPEMPPVYKMPPPRDFSMSALSLLNSAREQGLNDAWIGELSVRTSCALARLVPQVKKELEQAA